MSDDELRRQLREAGVKEDAIEPMVRFARGRSQDSAKHARLIRRLRMKGLLVYEYEKVDDDEQEEGD